jgi:ribonuclease R
VQVTGRFQPHPRGFGFVDLDAPAVAGPDGREVDSLFVPPDLARGWLAGDVVTAVAEADDQNRMNAVQLALVTRPRRFVVGRVATFAGRTMVRLDPRIGSGQLDVADTLAPKLARADGRQVVATVTSGPDGTAVCGALVTGPEPDSAPSALRARAVVIAHGGATPDSIPGGPEAAGLPATEVLGFALRATGHLAAGNPGLAAGLAADVGPVPGVELPLHDRRDHVAITIDADTTRDLDDAVSASWNGQPDHPVEIAVHIADVAGTVGIGSPADHYAATMATTTYFVAGGNAPMLDPALSEGELSLLPNEPRRVVTVWLSVAPDGSVSEPTIETAWIEPAARLSYAAVDAYLGTTDPHDLALGAHGPHGAVVGVLKDVTATLDAVIEASRRLGVERDGRDTLDTLFSDAVLEAAVVDGKIRAVPADPHPAAQRVVERMMVAANEAVAGWAAQRDLPLLYRHHVGFDPDRLHRLHAAAASVGADLTPADGEELDPADVLRLVDRLTAEGRDAAAAVVATAATGVVARASYSAEPARHGGLAAGLYTHFTSPIRRYADLIVHRQVRAALADEPLPYDRDQLARLGTWLDARAGAAGYAQALERNALWAVLLQRTAVTWPAEAIVTGLSPAGLRVRLVEPGIMGFVAAGKALGAAPRDRAALELDEHEIATVDGRFRLGQRLAVRLDRVDDLGRAELVPAD